MWGRISLLDYFSNTGEIQVDTAEFREGLEKHFGIKDCSKVICETRSRLNEKLILSIVSFDNWLQEQHGDYLENEGLSMQDFIEKTYGKPAVQWVLKTFEDKKVLF